MDDLISRSEVIKMIDPNCRNEEEFQFFKTLIEAVPTVDAKPVVHGSWIKGFLGEWQCSECREENCYAYDENLKRFTDLYCPECGAKMDGKKV